MMIKLFLVISLAVLGALAQDVEEVDFTLEGNSYTETVVNGVDSKFVVIRQQGAADHTIIMHDFKMKLTAFKDLTTQRCIIITLNPQITQAEGILFKDDTKLDQDAPSNLNIMLEVDEESIDDVEEEAGAQIADLCQELPTFRATIAKGESTPSPKSVLKRVKRGWLKKTWKKVKKHVKTGAKIAITRAITNGIVAAVGR